MASTNAPVSANVMAARLTRDLRRPITAKAVRSWVRANLATHDKVKHPEYQSHLYGAAEQAKITAGFKARTPRAVIQAEAKATKRAAKPTAKRPTAKATKPATTEAKPDAV